MVREITLLYITPDYVLCGIAVYESVGYIIYNGHSLVTCSESFCATKILESTGLYIPC